METYNINNYKGFKKDIDGIVDEECMLQMWHTAENIMQDLQKFVDDDFTEEERENEEDYIGAYFDDVLDIDYTINSRLEYKGVELCLVWGGPGIYLNTCENVIKCRWWGNQFDIYVPNEIIDLIDGYFEEYYKCCRA